LASGGASGAHGGTTNGGSGASAGGSAGASGAAGGDPGGGGAGGAGASTGGIGGAPANAFVHPGLLLRLADVERIRDAVAAGTQPYTSGFQRLTQESRAALAHQPKPFAVVTRTSGSGAGNAELRDDANAAFFHAVRWAVSGDAAHAAKAIEILDAWSGTLTAIDGDADRFLAAGIYGYQLANAAELLRHLGAPWPEERAGRLERLLLEVFYPLTHDFLLNHAGSRVDHHFANWDASMMVTIASIGVFANDRAKYAEAVDYFFNGKGNGAILRAVWDGETGQLQESGRDQAHAQLGIGLLAALCETAHNQGDDLYAAHDNRLLKGFEYTAQYLLGMDVPFRIYMDQSRTFTEISAVNRAQRRPIYEMVLNHYVGRRGLAAPFVEQLASAIRPEGYHGDHPGFGTLLFTR
jgi:hypothetical protein